MKRSHGRNGENPTARIPSERRAVSSREVEQLVTMIVTRLYEERIVAIRTLRDLAAKGTDISAATGCHAKIPV